MQEEKSKIGNASRIRAERTEEEGGARGGGAAAGQTLMGGGTGHRGGQVPWGVPHGTGRTTGRRREQQRGMAFRTKN